MCHYLALCTQLYDHFNAVCCIIFYGWIIFHRVFHLIPQCEACYGLYKPNHF